MTEPTRIRVATSASYDVLIGHGVLSGLREMLPAGAQRVAVVSPESLDHLVDGVADALEGIDTVVLQIPDGEDAKNLEVAAACWEALGEEGFTRSDAVVTLGGGATTDLGGFVAASWLRGVAVVHVPTTLLAMVDAAVGGKTGVNTGAGKNLVGAFHEPRGVLCDLSLLESLPRAELVAGLGEVVKCGFIADPRILELVEQADPDTLTAGSPVLRELVERAVQVKADVVAGDLRETGVSTGSTTGGGSTAGGGATAGGIGREALNYGHTLAHAIERVEDYRIRHGEAVAIGCVYVAELAARTGGLSAEVVARHRSALSRVGLPTSYDAAPFDDLLAAMRVDKKARGSTLRFVVLEDLARPVVLAGPDEADLRAAYDALAPAGAAR